MTEEDTITQKISENQFVHVRESSQQDMDELFKRSLSNVEKKSGWHEKKLPMSFFQEPHSREASVDGAHFSGGYVAVKPEQQSPSLGHHARGNSCPATVSIGGALPNVPASHHRRTGSFEGILDERSVENPTLPLGWEQAVTAEGKHYFINHNDRTTSWIDPRTMFLEGHHSSVPSSVVPAAAHESTPHAEGVLSPLPDGWELAKTPQGEVYFIDHVNKLTSWFDPRITSQPLQPTGGLAVLQQQQQLPSPRTVLRSFNPPLEQTAATVRHGLLAIEQQLWHDKMMHLQAEQENLDRQQEELRRQEALIRQRQARAGGHCGDHASEAYAQEHGLSSAIVDPFLSGRGIVGSSGGPVVAGGYHARQESGDSGLGGMRIPEEFIASVDEAMDSQDMPMVGGPKRMPNSTRVGAVDISTSMDFNETDDLVSSLSEDMHGLDRLDMLNATKLDLTWL